MKRSATLALIVAVLLQLSEHETNALKPFSWANVQKTIAKVGLSSFLIASQVISTPAFAIDTTFQDQLKVIQALQVEQQKTKVQNDIAKGGGAANAGQL